jgi:predicted glycosyltransferase
MTRYDLVMCHGDARILQLPLSFPETIRLSAKTRYSGFVTKTPTKRAEPRTGIVIAAGGGAAGGALFDAALAAKRLWRRETGTWSLIAGPRFDERALQTLRGNVPEGLTVEGAISNLSDRYATAALVVAQAGYNTVCEALSHGARLTVVPYAGGKETEQTIRAQTFERLGLLSFVSEANLTPQSLVAAMERALDAPTPPQVPNFNGWNGVVAATGPK